MYMIEVKIGQLRQHLSSLLKKVRKGEEIEIFDRDTKIGRILPTSAAEKEAFDIIPPAKGYHGLSSLSFSRTESIAATEHLIQERRKR